MKAEKLHSVQRPGPSILRRVCLCVSQTNQIRQRLKEGTSGEGEMNTDPRSDKGRRRLQCNPWGNILLSEWNCGTGEGRASNSRGSLHRRRQGARAPLRCSTFPYPFHMKPEGHQRTRVILGFQQTWDFKDNHAEPSQNRPSARSFQPGQR